MRSLNALAILLAGCSLSSSAIAPGGETGPGEDTSADSGFDGASDTGLPVDGGPVDGASVDASTDGGDASTADASTVDATPDAGATDYYDIDWVRPSAIPNTVDSTYCETDAVVTNDLQWLNFSRSSSTSGCYEDRRFYVMAWNDGSPGDPVGLLPIFDPEYYPETNAHPLPGSAAGRPAQVLFFYAAVPGGSGPRDVRAQWLRADGMGRPMVPDGATLGVPAVNTADGESDPSLTADGTEMVFTRFGDIYSVRGTPPSSYGAPTPLSELNTGDDELDPALSADGRVIAFARRGGDLDIYVARRRDPTGPFEAPERLPRGGSEINHSSDELDCFITAAGDLLFTTDRDGSTRLWRAPLAP